MPPTTEYSLGGGMMAAIPQLVDGRSFAVPQGYLAQSQGSPAPMPAQPEQMAAAQQGAQMIAGKLHDLGNAMTPAHDEMRAKAQDYVKTLMASIGKGKPSGG